MSLNDARVCEQITRRAARTFAVASYFLPREKRRAAFAVYAFCRQADDIVDMAAETDASPEIIDRHLREYRARLDSALQDNPKDAVFREIARVVRRFYIPHNALYELLEGVARDLSPVQFQTWEELKHYSHGVASTVGVMCAHIFGVIGHREDTLRCARTLGVAMQLTNVLRDVGEDARRGRYYLPSEDLTRFGITAEEIAENPVLAGDPRWRRFMAFEIARARQLYAEAEPGIAMLEPDARRCTVACSIGYAGILNAIERIDYDSIHRRARVSPAAKLGILCRAWWQGRSVVPIR